MKENSINASVKFITMYGREMGIPYYYTFDDFENIVYDYKPLMPVCIFSNIFFQITFTNMNFFVLFTKTTVLSINELESRRNSRAKIRESLISFVPSIRLDDLKTNKLIASVLYEMTSRYDELTRNASVKLKIQYILYIKF